MNTKGKRKFSIIVMLIKIVIGIWCLWLVIERPQPYKPRKEPIDTFVMGEAAPVKIITLNSYMTADENYEVAYVLGDKGNLYALCYDMGKYYVTLWHPEFWEEIEVVDICAERPYLYAAALDSEGKVYVWEKEYLLGEAENGTRNFLKENVKSIIQGYKGIAIQTADNENEVYIYNIDLFQNYYEEITFIWI